MRADSLAEQRAPPLGDATADADDEQRVARLQPRALQHAPRGEVAQRVRGTLLPRAVRRALHDVATRQASRQVRVTSPVVFTPDAEARAHRAVVAEGDDLVDWRDPWVDHDLVAYRDVVHSLAHGMDDARDVATGDVGSAGFGMPRVSQRSMWLSALATTLTTTSSGPGSGSGISPQR